MAVGQDVGEYPLGLGERTPPDGGCQLDVDPRLGCIVGAGVMSSSSPAAPRRTMNRDS